jgi:hypothetical protein
LWNESFYLDFVGGDGAVAGYARIGLYPNLGVTWWTTMLVGTDRPVVASVAYRLPVAGGTGLVFDADGYDVACIAERPLEAMSLRCSAPATVYEDAGGVYRGDPGRPATVGFDLTWTTDGTPYHYDITTRYEIPCLVQGEVTLDDQRIAVDGQGQRDHSWGVRDWWAFGWCWAAFRLDDGTRVHLADIRIPGMPMAFGYRQHGTDLRPVGTATVEESLGAFGMPTSGSAVVVMEGAPTERLDIDIEPLAFGPVLLEAPDGRVSHFPRACARFTIDDGRTGWGWIEWNQPVPTVASR